MTIAEIKRGESVRLEFKREVPRSDKRYLKTVVAFANGLGGSLVFGIDDATLDVVGVPDDDIRQIQDGLASAISSACAPAIIPAFSRETVKGKTLLVVDVYPGRNTPYRIKAEGLDGVYVRVGATTRKAEMEEVEDLILRGGNRTYDAMIDESEVASAAAAKRLGTRVAKAQREHSGETIKVTPLLMSGWGLLADRAGKWHPSMAFKWLVGDGFHFSRIQCALFADNERTEFLDRREYDGSVLDQIEEAHSFVLRSIRRGAVIEGLYRKDIFEIPPEALREAIVNAIAHRDYRLHSFVQVSIAPGFVEILSPGGLYDGLTRDEMLAGKSRLRNPILAETLHKMGVIEKWGTGIRRIFESCRKAGIEAPAVVASETTVSIRFPRLSKFVQQASQESTLKSDLKSDLKSGLKSGSDKTDAKLSKILADNPAITIESLQSALSLSRSGVKKALKRLQDAGAIRRVGPDKGGHWEIVK